jgi:16S rRNA pseudouridine516 synthase
MLALFLVSGDYAQSLTIGGTDRRRRNPQTSDHEAPWLWRDAVRDCRSTDTPGHVSSGARRRPGQNYLPAGILGARTELHNGGGCVGKDSERQRLDKVLAHIGIGSRKELKAVVKAGRVAVNGEAAIDVAMKVQPTTDLIEVDGERIRYREYIYLMMNKPPGMVSATEDATDETVVDLLDAEDKVFDVFPVGRLDKDTEGLLLLTNDGKLTHRLLSPKRHVPKLYFARVRGNVTEADAAAFAEGVTLDDGYETMPGELTILSSGSESDIELTIYEGKFHQVKRMFETVGKEVVYLKRLSMGPISLDDALQLGEYRELTEEETAALFSLE